MMRGWIGVGGLTLLAVCAVGIAPARATPVIAAPFVTAAVGDVVMIPISITDADDLSFFQFDLSFAASIVQADDEGASAGTLLPGDWFFTSTGAIDNVNGAILGVAASGLPFAGTGVIANVEFTAVSEGVSPLTISSVFLNLSDQGFESLSGQITVTGVAAIPDVPEPTTVVLVATGWVCGRARRMKSNMHARG